MNRLSSNMLATLLELSIHSGDVHAISLALRYELVRPVSYPYSHADFYQKIGQYPFLFEKRVLTNFFRVKSCACNVGQR